VRGPRPSVPGPRARSAGWGGSAGGPGPVRQAAVGGAAAWLGTLDGMDAEHTSTEEVVYTDEQRAATLAALLNIMGGEPPAEMLELVRRRDEEFAARRSDAA